MLSGIDYLVVIAYLVGIMVLGLYFARMIVERNEGAIDFPVGDSRGTIVRLAFPQAPWMALREAADREGRRRVERNR